MHRNARKHVALLLVCLLLFGTAALASDSLPVESYLNDIVSCRMQLCSASDWDEWVVKELAPSAGRNAEWYVYALGWLGRGTNLQPYASALERYVKENTVSSASTRLNLSLALISCGRPQNPFIGQSMEDSIGAQGVISWIYGLHLMNNGAGSSTHTREEIISTLLAMQKEGGGWAVTGSYADPDVTAMALQALSPHCGDSPEVRDAVDRAVSLLSEMQLEDGGFQSYGTENAESCAQVILALSLMGIDPCTDTRFLKNGCSPLDALLSLRLEDGSFSHAAGGNTSDIATAQAFCALSALHLLHEGLELPNGFILSIAEESGSSVFTPLRCLVAGGALALALIVCLILFLRKKRGLKVFAPVLLAGLLVCVLSFCVDLSLPSDYYGAADTPEGEAVGTVTLTIRCDTAAGLSDAAPESGVILPVTEFSFSKGETVYDILIRAAKAHSILIENSGTAASAYISGINSLCEFSLGDLSGWVFHVNGESSSVGCSDYSLQDGDAIEWLYTLSLGEDLFPDR